MRILITIPHYFHKSGDVSKPLPSSYGSLNDDLERRAASLQDTVTSLHQLFGFPQAMIRVADRTTIPANQSMQCEIHVVVVTVQHQHLLHEAELGSQSCHHCIVDHDPSELGFACQRVLRDRWGNYDIYGFLEDDLAIRDPWFFEKLRWFNGHVGDECVLLPNRYELSMTQLYQKCYLDGDLAERVTQPFQDISVMPELSSTVLGKGVRLVRPLNPHSGCFFLTAAQMKKWISSPTFGVATSAFVGPLESAATLGVMTQFRVYKPAPENASFLEIQHAGERFARLIRRRQAP
ncbi:MAG: calcium-binding protein [Planctomycetota bacterium]